MESRRLLTSAFVAVAGLLGPARAEPQQPWGEILGPSEGTWAMGQWFHGPAKGKVPPSQSM